MFLPDHHPIVATLDGYVRRFSTSRPKYQARAGGHEAIAEPAIRGGARVLTITARARDLGLDVGRKLPRRRRSGSSGIAFTCPRFCIRHQLSVCAASRSTHPARRACGATTPASATNLNPDSPASRWSECRVPPRPASPGHAEHPHLSCAYLLTVPAASPHH